MLRSIKLRHPDQPHVVPFSIGENKHKAGQLYKTAVHTMRWRAAPDASCFWATGTDPAYVLGTEVKRNQQCLQTEWEQEFPNCLLFLKPRGPTSTARAQPSLWAVPQSHRQTVTVKMASRGSCLFSPNIAHTEHGLIGCLGYQSTIHI